VQRRHHPLPRINTRSWVWANAHLDWQYLVILERRRSPLSTMIRSSMMRPAWGTRCACIPSSSLPLRRASLGLLGEHLLSKSPILSEAANAWKQLDMLDQSTVQRRAGRVDNSNHTVLRSYRLYPHDTQLWSPLWPRNSSLQ